MLYVPARLLPLRAELECKNGFVSNFACSPSAGVSSAFSGAAVVVVVTAAFSTAAVVVVVVAGSSWLLIPATPVHTIVPTYHN